METYESIVEKLKNIDGIGQFLTKKELKELPSILWEDEVVEDLVTGTYNNHMGIVVATNKRVIFIDKSLFGKLYVEDIPYDKISSIQYETAWLSGKITFYTSGNKATIKDVMPKENTRRFAEFVRARITKPQEHASFKENKTDNTKTSTDFIAELERLAKLKKEGLLTDEEFELAKKKLLS